MNLLIAAVSSATGPSGICRHAYNLVRCAIRGTEVKQVALVVGKWQELYFRDLFKLENAKVLIISIDIPNKALARNLWYLHGLPRLTEGLGVDVLHLSFPVPIHKTAIRCPIVVSLHDLYPYEEPDNFGFPKVLFNRMLLEQCLEEVDRIACVSETTLSRLRARFPRLAHKKALAIHNCVTIQHCKSKALSWEQHHYFLMVAQHRANKNIPLALEVFDQLLCGGILPKDTLLILVGNQGPETLKISKVAKRRLLRKNVKLVMGVSDEELKWLYQNCNLLIAPSLAEGFGLPVVEALLCGARVICSDIPAFREIGGGSCEYFDLHAESPALAMKLAICRALEGPARSLPQLEKFSLEHVTEKYATLYDRLRAGYKYEKRESATGRTS
jgi:glycosyltransferase involved in cell wall biosynthesis